jgi:hypothetical protein
LSAARVFTVVLRLPPQITIGSPGPGQVALSFDAIVGRTYRVDYKNNLSDETWVPLAAPAPAQGNTVSVQDQLGVNPQRFYRIVQLD